MQQIKALQRPLRVEKDARRCKALQTLAPAQLMPTLPIMAE
jgi:hypothetical protein